MALAILLRKPPLGLRSPKTAAKLKSHYVRYGRTKCKERAKVSGDRNRLGYPAALCGVGKLLPRVRKAATVEILDNPLKQAFQLCSRRNHYYWKGKGSFRNISGATLVLSSMEVAGRIELCEPVRLDLIETSTMAHNETPMYLSGKSGY